MREPSPSCFAGHTNALLHLLFLLLMKNPNMRVLSLWKQYWTAALNEERNPPAAVKDARERYDKYMAILDKAINNEESQKGGNKQKSASPLVLGWQQDS